MNKERFLVITANRFPTGDAGAVRLMAFASIIKELGYNPMVIGMGETTGFQNKTYDGIEYYSLRYKRHNIFFRILGRLLYAYHLKKVVKLVEKQISGILIDSGDRLTFSVVNKLAKKHGIKPIYDSVEWYSASEFKNGSRNRAYRYNNNLNTKLIDNRFNVIAISSYLEKHFSNRGITTVRIPVIMDVEAMPNLTEKRGNCEKIKIVYAGSMGKKDHVQEMLDGLAMLSKEEASKVLFCVIGITREQYESNGGNVPNGIDESVRFMGRISREEVLEHLASADFSFLLRPSDERYAKAGFPTKVVEALSSGVPMICNYSSDLEKYLVDNENAVIIDGCSAHGCAEALQRTLKLSVEQLHQLRLNARKTAEEHFDWRLYQDTIMQVLN